MRCGSGGSFFGPPELPQALHAQLEVAFFFRRELAPTEARFQVTLSEREHLGRRRMLDLSERSGMRQRRRARLARDAHGAQRLFQQAIERDGARDGGSPVAELA